MTTIDWDRIDRIKLSIDKEMTPYHDYHEGELERMNTSITHLAEKVLSLVAVLVITEVITLEEIKEIL